MHHLLSVVFNAIGRLLQYGSDLAQIIDTVEKIIDIVRKFRAKSRMEAITSRPGRGNHVRNYT
jgi:hypothetical protein